MKSILSTLVDRAGSLATAEPAVALFLGAALLTVFFSVWRSGDTRPTAGASLAWTLYRHMTRCFRAVFMVAILVGTLGVARIYLTQTVGKFQGLHGRITQANYNAVQTIWGAEQRQTELTVQLYNDEEVVERIESEDLTKPAVLRKKTVRRFAGGNPFVAARHEVTLRQSPRKKGSALYVGYETECRFTWRLKNPAAEAFQGVLTLPLPSTFGMYDALSATLNGQEIPIEIQNGALVLSRAVEPNETMDLAIGFKSRGMSFWYFQVSEPREIRDFTLTLRLPDLAKGRLNYPEGCMTPTGIQTTANGAGTLLTYRLDHALSNKGMGVALPKLPQPGAATNAVLRETERAWLLLFALFALSFALASVEHPILMTVLFGSAAALAYGLLGDFNDLLLGFWGTALLVWAPSFLLLASLAGRVLHGLIGRCVAVQLLVFGLVYPCLAGLDHDRQGLYQNMCAVGLLAFAAWLFSRMKEGQRAPIDDQKGARRFPLVARESPPLS